MQRCKTFTRRRVFRPNISMDILKIVLSYEMCVKSKNSNPDQEIIVYVKLDMVYPNSGMNTIYLHFIITPKLLSACHSSI